VAAIIATLGAPVVALWPPVFRSTATILIEEQEIPRELVRSTVTSFADERIQVISQQVMTRTTLNQIIQRYDLYGRERRFLSTEEILERMRKDIKVQTVNADVTDRRSGSRSAATIAFTLSYDYSTPASAQRVANELVSLYLNENLKTRRQKAEETLAFLSEESSRLSEHIDGIQGKLATFKRENSGRLPELMQLNMQLRDKAETDLRDIDRQILLLEDRRIYLDGQLSGIKPSSPLQGAGGDRVLEPDERLRSLKNQLASLSGVYAEQHPDLVRMRREIAALEKSTGAAAAAAGPDADELARSREQLGRLRERYAEDHPDVVRARRSLVALEAARVPAAPAAAPAERKPDNPVYISLRTQIESIDKEVESLRKQKDDVRKRMSDYQVRIEQTPGVEQRYLDLSRDHENSLTKYRELRMKQMEAEVAQVLEKESKGERFSLIDPPQFPERPNRPNRPLLGMFLLAIAIGGGLGFAGLREALDRSVRGTRWLGGALDAPLLAVIPFVELDRHRERRRRRRLVLLGSAAALALAGLLAAHFLVMPLDTLWFTVSRRFMF
jgi:succinoglycan biosynthesis transport protein ExoP